MRLLTWVAIPAGGTLLARHACATCGIPATSLPPHPASCHVKALPVALHALQLLLSPCDCCRICMDRVQNVCGR